MEEWGNYGTLDIDMQKQIQAVDGKQKIYLKWSCSILVYRCSIMNYGSGS